MIAVVAVVVLVLVLVIFLLGMMSSSLTNRDVLAMFASSKKEKNNNEAFIAELEKNGVLVKAKKSTIINRVASLKSYRDRLSRNKQKGELEAVLDHDFDANISVQCIVQQQKDAVRECESGICQGLQCMVNESPVIGMQCLSEIECDNGIHLGKRSMADSSASIGVPKPSETGCQSRMQCRADSSDSIGPQRHSGIGSRSQILLGAQRMADLIDTGVLCQQNVNRGRSNILPPMGKPTVGVERTSKLAHWSILLLFKKMLCSRQS